MKPPLMLTVSHVTSVVVIRCRPNAHLSRAHVPFQTSVAALGRAGGVCRRGLSHDRFFCCSGRAARYKPTILCHSHLEACLSRDLVGITSMGITEAPSRFSGRTARTLLCTAPDDKVD